MWQGLLALKNDQAAVQMYFVSGNDTVAKCSLPKNNDGSTPPPNFPKNEIGTASGRRSCKKDAGK